MFALLCFLAVLASPFKSTSRLEAENAALRHQVTVLPLAGLSAVTVPSKLRSMWLAEEYLVQHHVVNPHLKR
jgi:hypothetical protein